MYKKGCRYAPTMNRHTKVEYSFDKCSTNFQNFLNYKNIIIALFIPERIQNFEFVV